MKKVKIIPVILCGGSGTRLWPLSRASFPKQYIPLLSKSGKSLLQETILRIEKLDYVDRPIFICNEEHRFLVAEQMREINISPKSIILEPKSKNTCPAITLAALKSAEDNFDDILLILSSDHLIKGKDKFLETINKAIQIAHLDKLVTFGILPTSPETGYGYIKAGKPLKTNNIESFEIDKFLEKPSLEIAEKLILNKDYTWNSGMFVFKTKVFLEELKKFQPEILNCCKKSLINGFKDLDFQRIDKNEFEKSKEISFDVAIMESTDLGVVLPLNADWSDIGSWDSLWKNEDKDNDGNVISGKVLAKEVTNSYLRSDNRLIVCNGVENLIVIETNDAILISNKTKSQKIKDIVKELNEKGFPEANKHRRVHRPWGNYLSIAEDLKWQVKKIEVKPSAQLSLQMHKYRAEHWIVVKGIAKVSIDNKESILKENQSIFIPLGSKHRLSNPGKTPLLLIEVQSGSYLGEDDIVRFKDDYGRN